METKRLNKAISETGYCSRREADRLIEAGAVDINGKLAELGTKVTSDDVISVDGNVITKKQVENIYLAFNKPDGIVCTTDLNVKGNIIDYIDYPERIFHVGRLDKPSEGLIFMTNDGDIVNKILRSKNNHEKEYIATVDQRLTTAFLEDMSNGVPILDTMTKPCVVKKIDPYTFSIILTEGLNRQIRRMCSHFGYGVVKLKRIRIMNISIGDLRRGEYRSFTKTELKELLELVEDSSVTHED